MKAIPEIKMLDWKEGLAESGATLVQGHLMAGGDPAKCAVLLPGRRVRRQFQNALVEASIRAGAGDTLQSPRLLTAANLVDAFFEPDSSLGPVDESVSLLFWSEAFRALGQDAGLLLGRGQNDSSSLALARVAPFRQVCEELDAIGMSPEDVLGSDFEHGSDDRWRALGVLRQRAHERLRSSGLTEKTLLRRQMITNGALRPDAPEVLFVLGVTDPGPLTCALIERLSDRVRILIQGSSDSQGEFDEFGRPLSESWLNRPSVVPLEVMSLVDRPIDAAEVLLERLASASQGSPLESNDFIIGLCDERQAGILERCGRRADVPLRSAAGSSLSNGEVSRVLEALSDYLRSPDIEVFSALVRLPSIERILFEESDCDPIRRLDSWREKRIGGTLDDLLSLPADTKHGGDDVLQDALGRLDLMLSPLQDAPDARARTLATGSLLRSVFEASRDEGMISKSLEIIEDVLATLNSCDGIPFTSASALFDLLSRSLKSARCPAPPIDPARGAIEMLGWLDVRNDPAPNMILVGFNDSGELGPAPSDGWLTQTLRGSLGLPTEESRRARDAHAMHAICARTPNLHVIVTRHDHRGDPVVPSRLFLGSGGEESARRVTATMSSAPRSFPAHLLSGSPRPVEAAGFLAPDMPDHDPIVRLRVTDFASWIRSPRRFWLERFKKLRTIDSNHFELDARAFGNLAHDVLDSFGKGPLKNSMDEARIASFLESKLDELVALRYGRPCAPAIEIQRRMLRDRLARFAVLQARDAADGWRSHSVEDELECSLDIPGDVPVTLVGRVDRIDRHEDGRWRVLDYKTSESPVKASSKRNTKGVWNDLQLPLYDHLMRHEVAGSDDVIELGYVSLPRELREVTFSIATKWDAEIIESGIELARTIVREMRSADFTRPPKSGSFGREIDGIDRILRSSVLVTGEDEEEEADS